MKTQSPPAVTLTTDFGLRDPWVAAIKGVITAIAPVSPLIDLSHRIGPQAVLEGALFVASAIPCFPAGT
ncbi:MAG: SAM-dependent chlorinase/fluorinase, partial [Candidatus Hydrogenedentes bacterium]|nr:SAM-dependent chlorinase/fluorinase [Candidatus Hydrogenedentota bacterium]